MIQASTVLSRIQQVKQIGDSLFILRFDRGHIDFQPGQYVHLGVPGHYHRREYSIYSGVDDDFLEVLFRKVHQGLVSPLLAKLKPGDQVVVEGPFGGFLKDARKKSESLVFLATGSGISPFHSFVRSFPRENYRMIYGLPYFNESVLLGDFEKFRVTLCVSREALGHYYGRLTEYLKENPLNSKAACYLCGNSDMIYEAHRLLVEQGIDREEIFAEIYF